MRVAYLIAGSTAVAEEVTQEAFVSVYERWSRLDSPGGYLRQCVVNRALSAVRRERRGDQLMAISPSLLPAEVGPGHDHMLDAVRRLPAKAHLDLRISDVLTRAAESAQLAAPTRADITTLAGRRRQRRRVRAGLLAAAAVTLVVVGAVALLDRDAPGSSPSGEAEVPVAESLALRGDGLGEFDFGSPMADVMAAVTAELGSPLRNTKVEGAPNCQPVARDVSWEDLALTFEGPADGALVLTSWYTDDVASNPQVKRMRMAGGPAMGEPLPAWQAAFGSQFHATPGFPANFTIDLPGGRVTGNADRGDPPEVTSLASQMDCVLGD